MITTEIFADYLTKSILIVPIIIGVTQVAKSTRLPDNYAPVVALIIGVMLALMTNGHVPWGQSVLGGLIYGLSAAGLYSSTKTLIGK